MDITAKAGFAGRRAEHSDLLDHAVRVGLVAYGLVHLLIAWLAVRLAFGDGGQSASSQGAMHELASTSLGRLSLYVVAGGLFALVVWQLLEALFGHRDEDGGKRVFKRVVSAVKAIIYGTLGVSALKVAIGSGSSGAGTDSTTSKLMSMPAGPVIVAVVGVVVLVVAGALFYRGLSEGFADKLDFDGRTGNDGRAYLLFGKIGYASKGIALAIIGGLFIWAAVTHDPQKSGGLDQALHKLLQAPFGTPLLVAVAAGIACFGLFCFAWARHLNR
jgi:Domain of Unknown Function (DUF1206)